MCESFHSLLFASVCLCLLQEYGDIEYCVIIKNKSTGESKGLGYVRYYKPSQAALAIENCDKSKIVPNSCTDSFFVVEVEAGKKFKETFFMTLLFTMFV